MDEKAAHRIRALLAKAESTSFPAEAAALRAKAEHLMARHQLTEADINPAPAPPQVIAQGWVVYSTTARYWNGSTTIRITWG